jgi:GT2 family glycosyltransferase
MRDYAIIIPSKTENNIRVCLEALKSKQPSHLTNVIVYNNDRSGGVDNACTDYGVTRVEAPLEPFVFSKAVNECMMRCPNYDVIVMNDDAILQTMGGLTRLHIEAGNHPEFGIVSSSVFGFVGNPEQCHRPDSRFIRSATLHTVVFICVHISRDLINKIGPLDERLIHYGWEDNLYCLQARAAGYKLGVFDGCVVEHGELPSTYRTGKTIDLNANQKIFESIVQENGLTPYWPVPFSFPVLSAPSSTGKEPKEPKV